MNQRTVVLGFAAVVLLTLLALVFVRPRPSGASTLSPSGHGWLAARRYLEERGAQVELHTRAWDEDGWPDVLAVGLPLHRVPRRDELRALDRWLRGGGVLVLGYSGGFSSVGEQMLLRELGLPPDDVLGRAPASPRLWREHVDREWRLLPDERLGREAKDLRVRAQRFVPRAPRAARVWYRAPKDVAAVFEVDHGAGRVVVLPAEALANRRLGEIGHADLLETLWRAWPARWSFDEYHHGLGAPPRGDDARAVTFDAFLLQMLLLYVASLLAVVRRFGPAWEDPPLQAASTAAFLRGLGVQHDRRRHHASAAALLVARVTALHPWMKPPAPAGVTDGRSLLALARHVGRLQGGR